MVSPGMKAPLSRRDGRKGRQGLHSGRAALRDGTQGATVLRANREGSCMIRSARAGEPWDGSGIRVRGIPTADTRRLKEICRIQDHLNSITRCSYISFAEYNTTRHQCQAEKQRIFHFLCLCMGRARKRHKENTMPMCFSSDYPTGPSCHSLRLPHTPQFSAG